MALFKQIESEDLVIDFLKELELWVMYILLGTNKRFQARPIFEAIEYLNQQDFEAAKGKITLEKLAREELRGILQEGQIKDNDWAKLMIARYLWAKDMDHPKDVVELDLNYKQVTLEHIIPQTPDSQTNWKKDFSDQFRKNYTYKLGNMTLLTQKMNSKVKNYDFGVKRKVYNKMKLAMTVSIGQEEHIDEAFIVQRHKEITTYLIKHLKL